MFSDTKYDCMPPFSVVVMEFGSMNWYLNCLA